MLLAGLAVALAAPAVSLATTPEEGGTPGTTVNVTPSDNLPNSSAVTVAGSGFGVNVQVLISQCTQDVPALCKQIGMATTNASQVFTATVSVTRSFVPDTPDPVVDCSAVACVLDASNTAVAPKFAQHHLQFAPAPDPEPEPTPTPTTTTTTTGSPLIGATGVSPTGRRAAALKKCKKKKSKKARKKCKKRANKLPA